MSIDRFSERFSPSQSRVAPVRIIDAAKEHGWAEAHVISHLHICDFCTANEVIAQFDNSGGEYDGVSICERCIRQLADELARRRKGLAP